MITGGISCIGSYHNINQDYYICTSSEDGVVLVLSDGMGSKKFSQFGSKAICETVCKKFQTENRNLSEIQWRTFLEECHENGKRLYLNLM
ncbi:MAG: protein phosphatase 2C domain-containing protein [Suipraeoptans sp.]